MPHPPARQKLSNPLPETLTRCSAARARVRVNPRASGPSDLPLSRPLGIWHAVVETAIRGGAVPVLSGPLGGGDADADAIPAVGAEVAGVVPPTFVALTTTRSVWATSDGASVKVVDVAPETLAH